MNTYIYISAGAAIAAPAALLIFFLLRWRRDKKEESGVLYWQYQDAWLLNAFDNYDCAVYGFRGMGKDVIFARVINLKCGNAVRLTPYLCRYKSSSSSSSSSSSP